MDFYVLFCNTLIYFRVQATHLTNCTCITVSVQSVKFRQQIKEHSDTKLIPLHFAKAHEYIQCVVCASRSNTSLHSIRFSFLSLIRKSAHTTQPEELLFVTADVI